MVGGGGPGDAGNIFLRVGLTLFRTHDATLEPWIFTPSAAFLTESTRFPEPRFEVRDSVKSG